MRYAVWSVVLLGALLGSPSWGYAQDDPASDQAAPQAPPDDTGEIDLGEIAIEGAAPPTLDPAAGEPAPEDATAAVEPRQAAQQLVVERERIEASGATTLDQLLEKTPGFTVSSGFTGQAATFQGLPAKFSAVLVDGQRIPGSVLDTVDFGQLSLDGVDRVEVLRGPQALAYGAGIGTVVNLIMATSRDGETTGALTEGQGSFGWQRHGIRLRGGTDDGTEGWSVSAARQQRAAYDLDPRQPDTDGDSFRQFDLHARYSRDFGENTLNLRLDSFTETRRGLTFSPPNLTRNNDTSTQRGQLGGSWRWGLADGGSLELRQDFGHSNHSLQRYYPGFPATLQETGFGDRLADTHLDYRRRGDGTGLAAGLHYSYNRLRSDRISGAGVAHSRDTAAYAGYSWELGQRWTASTAARLDAPSRFSTTVSPQASLRYAMGAQSALALSIARGHRTPSLREQFYEFDSPFGYTVIGNPNLRPESSWDYNFDYDYAGRRGSVHAGLFLHEVQDLIDFSEIQPSPQIFQTVNIGSARTYGADVSLERSWSAGRDGRDWGVGWSASYLPHAADESTGLRLPNSPLWNQTARVFYRAEDHKLNAQVQLHTVSSRYLDLANTDQAPAYSTVDATFSRRLGGGKLQLSGLNLLDRKDGKYGPEPGREMRAEYSYDF